jgi:hypothetical protein
VGENELFIVAIMFLVGPKNVIPREGTYLITETAEWSFCYFGHIVVHIATSRFLWGEDFLYFSAT